MNNLRTTFILILLLLPGCAVGPDYNPPTLSLPSSYSESSGSETIDQQPNWWSCFGDTELEWLIDQSIGNNKSLHVALSRVNEARASLDEAYRELLPGGSIGGEYTRFRNSSSGMFGDFGNPGEQEFARVDVDASWEIDIFGRLRRRVERNEAEAEMTEADLADALRIVIAEVIHTYAELRGAQTRLEVAKRNAALQSETFKLTSDLVSAGASTEFDSARSKTQLRATESTVPGFEAETKIAIHALSLLTVTDNSVLEKRLLPTKSLITCSVPENVGIPADLLRRRPDLRSAERNLAAATAGVGVAVAEWFPKFNLLGNLAYEAPKLSRFEDGDEAYTFGPTFSWPILTFGRIRDRVDQANEQAKQALLNYELAVLTAIKEAEDAMARLKGENARTLLLREAAESSRKATQLARIRYESGEEPLLTLLDAQRAMLAVEESLASSERDQTLALVALYKALGGGWEYVSLGKSTDSEAK